MIRTDAWRRSVSQDPENAALARVRAREEAAARETSARTIVDREAIENPSAELSDNRSCVPRWPLQAKAQIP